MVPASCVESAWLQLDFAILHDVSCFPVCLCLRLKPSYVRTLFALLAEHPYRCSDSCEEIEERTARRSKQVRRGRVRDARFLEARVGGRPVAFGVGLRFSLRRGPRATLRGRPEMGARRAL